MPKEEYYSSLFKDIVVDRLRQREILQHIDENLFVLDRGWYCIMVEFQTSQWSNGIYFKVGVDLNFYPMNYFLFGRIKKEINFAEFFDEKQCGEILHSLCDMAIWEVYVLDEKFCDLHNAKRAVDASMDVWSYYEKGVLTALTGDFEKARQYISRQLSLHSYGNQKEEFVGFAKDVVEWMDCEEFFLEQIVGLINRCRTVKKLPILEQSQMNLDLVERDIVFVGAIKHLFSNTLGGRWRTLLRWLNIEKKKIS